MAWYDDVDHVTVASSIPKELVPLMLVAKGSLTRSMYIRTLIEADVASKGIEVTFTSDDAESAA